MYIGGKDQLVVDGTTGAYTAQQLGLVVNIELRRPLPPYAANASEPQRAPVAANDNNPIRATQFVLRDPSLIPPREWLFGSHYARKYLTATFGAGGGGKSANAVTELLSMVTGRPLLGGAPAKPLRVWYLNLEDPAVEIERRFAGAAKHFGVTAEQIGDRLYTDSGRDQEFVVMKMDGRGTKVCEPVVRQIIAEIKAREIDVLVVDPFVSTHEVEENDNSKIQQVAALWVSIADQTNCSVELIHHVTKGNLEVTADSGRGAGALKDKARSVRVINPMAEAQATSAGIPKEEASGYFRVEMGKANLTKGGGKPTWRRFASVGLGNGPKTLGLALNGDSIGVVEPWSWPTVASAVEDVPVELLDGLKARMGASNYRESEQSADWAGHLVGEIFGMDSSDKSEKATIKRMLTAWIAEGHFTTEMRPDLKRTPRKHLVPVFASPPQKQG
jgi:hypothetical protein